jgi:hypothetical protein
MPALQLPTLAFSKVLTYKDTPIYRDPVMNVVLATIPAGKSIPIASPELLGWIGVGLLEKGKAVIGFAKVADVAVEADRMRLAVRTTKTSQSYSGPSEVFQAGTQLAPGTIATAFQESNGYYRIGASTWVATADTQTIDETGKRPSTFDYKKLIPYAVAAAVVGVGVYYYRKSHGRKSEQE